MKFKASLIAAFTTAAAGFAAGLYMGIAIGVEEGTALMREPLQGPATASDGDTITITNALGKHNVRIYGADALESRQTCRAERAVVECGKDARDITRALLAEGDVKCDKIEDRDRYGRYVAVCFSANGTDIGRHVIQRGYAVEYTDYSDGRYTADEAAAKNAKRGMWGMRFQPPAEWRKCNTGAIDARPKTCPAGP